MRKLSEYQIARLHQLRRDGHKVGEIAQALEVHRNTITLHLSLRCQYSPALIAKLCLRSPLPAQFTTLRVQESAALLPGFPSPRRLQKLVSAGVLDIKKRAGRWTTTEAAIRKASRKMLPQGLWIDSRNIALYFRDVEAIEEIERVDCQYWPCKQYAYISATKACKIEEPRIPIAILSRVATCLKISGVATI